MKVERNKHIQHIILSIQLEALDQALAVGMDEMVGWHHRLNGHEFEQAQGVGEGEGSLACCSPWGHKDLDTSE